MRQETISALVSRFSEYSRIVEIGIGGNSAVATALSGVSSVKATDIVPCDVPNDVQFYIDDIRDPSPEVYADSDLIYGLNFPPDLQLAASACAARFNAEFAFTTLGFDPSVASVTPETIPGDTVYWYANPVETGGLYHGSTGP